jgi:hypothetical protein
MPTVAGHARGRKKGKCPKCGRKHDRSAHWSHKVAHKPKWYGRVRDASGKIVRPQRKKKAKKRTLKSATTRRRMTAGKSPVKKASVKRLRRGSPASQPRTPWDKKKRAAAKRRGGARRKKK